MKIRKIAKIAAVTVLIPIVLFLLLAVLIYIPAVQNAIVTQVTEIASEQSGMDIRVGKVRLQFPLDLSIEDVKVLKPNPRTNRRDTIADIRSVVADVKLMPLFRGNVDIDNFTFNDASVNTSDLIASTIIKGNIGKFYLQSRGIDLTNDSVTINSASLDNADVTICLTDSVTEEDTTTTENNWKIYAREMSINSSDVKLFISGDTLAAGASLGSFMVYDTNIDLGRGVYAVKNITASNSAVTYDNIRAEAIEGFDYNHISLDSISLALDSVMYSPNCTRAVLNNLQFRERSGIALSKLQGRVFMDSLRVHVPQLQCITDNSEINLSADMDFSALDIKDDGTSRAMLSGYVGKQDIMLFMGAMPDEFRKRWPAQPLRLNLSCNGNVKKMDITRMALNLPTAINIDAEGSVSNLMGNRKTGGKFNVDINTYDLGFVTSLVDYPVNIPHLTGNANFDFEGDKYFADLLVLQKDSASISASASYDVKTEEYEALLQTSDINVHDFLPADSLYNIDAAIQLNGKKVDVFDKYTDINFKAEVKRLVYGSYDVSGINFEGRLDDGHAIADIFSRNDLLKGRVTFDALLDRKNIRTTFACDILKADLQRMGIYKVPLSVGVCAHVDLSTDLEDYFKINGFINDITITDEKTDHRPRGIVMNVNTSADTTYADVKCGDMSLYVNADGGFRRLITVGDTLISKLNNQFAERVINQRDIISCLPNAQIRMNSGKENFFSKILKFYGMEFEKADMKLDISPKTGLNGNIDINSMVMGEALLDSINFAIMSDSTECKYHARIKNNMRNPKYVFTAISDGYVFDRGLGCNLKYIDRSSKVGLDLGIKASMLNGGINIEMSNLNPILGYIPFKVNDGNHVFFDHDGRMHADVKIIAHNGTGLMLYSNESNMEAKQDLTLSAHKMDLERIFSVMPYMPRVTGNMNGDFHIVQDDDMLSMSSAVNVKRLTYETSPMGDVGTEFVYMPLNDGSHFVDGLITQNNREIATVSGKYMPGEKDDIDVLLSMKRFPMDITNGFFPYHLLGLHGYAEGDVTVKGSTDRPIVDGELFLDSSYIESVPFGVEMRFANDPVRIVGSNLLFENFELFSHNDNPLDIYGKLDFSDLEDINMDIKMQTHDFLLVDSKEKKYSVAYGQALVDFYGKMKGPLNKLNMTGRLDVLSNTDLVYILRDSPLSTDNRMEELVKFVNFKDTARVEKDRPELSGLDMDMHVVVEEGAHVVCNLNADKTNYVDLMGGGRLRMQYNVLDDFRLTGRYTLSSGEMKYSLPVIPLKTFAITDGSYVEFTGDAMNPRLNITATEHTSASVSGDDGGTRTVEFDCGVEVTRTLNDMGLKFIISAPEDMSVQNQLAAMSEEQRGKLAVTMLTTGMYLSDGNTSAFSMNNALSSFLQSEINQIASSAMKTMDVSVGVDNTTNAAGAQHTDYSFKFAKRFWNNRMKIIVGGSVSTGAEMENSNNSFFDNVSFEYRLDKNASKNLRLFYEREAYDLLEGEVSEYGVGFVWRKRMRNFMDLFRKEKKVNLFENEIKDSIMVNGRPVTKNTVPAEKQSAAVAHSEGIPTKKEENNSSVKDAPKAPLKDDENKETQK